MQEVVIMRFVCHDVAFAHPLARNGVAFTM